MSTYTEAELEQLLADPESDLSERKESLRGDAPTKVRQAVCAFANDLPNHDRPGVVCIGVADDGTPTGLDVTDELLRQLADVKTDGNIVPPPTMTVRRQQFRGREIAVVEVFPSDAPPVRYKGRIHIRTGPRAGIASAQDERILNEKRRHRDRPFDSRAVPSAQLGDLSREAFEREYLPSAFATDILDANDRTYEERLAATKMVVSANEPVPTVVGMLTLSPRTRDYVPGAYVQFLRIAGTQLADEIVDEQVVDGSISDLLRRLEEKIDAHNRVGVDVTGGSRESRQRTYPVAALHQLVRNAVMHRTYEATNAPIRMTWFDDRIEIISPGGPFGTVRADNFGTPGVADYRNPNIAEAMRVLGFVQRFGVGIATARRLLAENGNPPPEFDVRPTVIAVIVRARA
jgi:ATP-dependent DNA helicase RecG